MLQEPAKKRRSTLAKVATQMMGTPMKTVRRMGNMLQVAFLLLLA